MAVYYGIYRRLIFWAERGWNQLAGYRLENILQCLSKSVQQTDIEEYGDGHAADKIIQTLLHHKKTENR